MNWFFSIRWFSLLLECFSLTDLFFNRNGLSSLAFTSSRLEIIFFLLYFIAFNCSNAVIFFLHIVHWCCIFVAFTFRVQFLIDHNRFYSQFALEDVTKDESKGGKTSNALPNSNVNEVSDTVTLPLRRPVSNNGMEIESFRRSLYVSWFVVDGMFWFQKKYPIAWNKHRMQSMVISDRKIIFEGAAPEYLKWLCNVFLCICAREMHTYFCCFFYRQT